MCPICGKRADPDSDSYPFCGNRCRTIDLGAWASEEYTIPGKKTEADEHYDLTESDSEFGNAYRDD